MIAPEADLPANEPLEVVEATANTSGAAMSRLLTSMTMRVPSSVLATKSGAQFEPV